MEHVSLKEERPESTVQLGHDITAVDHQSLVSLLQEYKDAFAFGAEEMPNIALNVEHPLNVDPQHKPVIKKKRYMGLERAAATNAGVQKLLQAGFIREYH